MRVENLYAIINRFKRIGGHRLAIDSAEQMVHHRVADKNYLRDKRRRIEPGHCQHLADHLADVFANRLAQGRSTALRDGKVNSAHYVGAVLCLGVQRAANSENLTCSQIQKLGHECRGAKIDRDSKALLRSEQEAGIVGKNRSIPLPQFDNDVAVNFGLARKAGGRRFRPR